MYMRKQLKTRNEVVPDQTSQDKIKRARDYISMENTIYSPDWLLESFTDYMNGKVRTDKVTEKDMCMFKDALFVLGLDTHTPVAESVDDEYRYFINEIIQRIEREYGCKTSIEKILAETIALSHIRIICLSKTMNNYILGKISINKEINDYYRIIGKELDRAQRQLDSAIMTMRQIKMPRASFKINAKTAFIAQNQQVDKHEINDLQ